MSLLYITFPTFEEALAVAHKALGEKLVACANVLPGATSVFAWQGEIQQQQEAILFAKTTPDKVDAAIKRIKELHPYELPCIISLRVEAGFPPFLKWVNDAVN